MRILFLEPPVDYPKPYYFTGVHLGLLSIVGYLRKHAPSVKSNFVSLQVLKASGRDLPVSRLFSDLKPEVLCLTAITSSFPYATQIAKEAKEFGSIVILGGIFASANAESIITNYPVFDVVVRGEGEKTLLDTITAVTQEHYDLANIEGITFKRDGNVFSSRDRVPLEIGEIPSPAYEFAPIELLHWLKVPATLETSRGCPYRCAFCTLIDPSMWGRYYREKSISQVIRELHTVKEYGFNRVDIADATFAVNEARVIALCNEITKQRLHLECRVECRVDLLSDYLLETMSKAGINEIILGVENVDTGALSSMHKTRYPFRWRRQVLDVIRNATSLGITTHPVIMLGWPGETIDSLNRLVDFTISLLNFRNVQPFITFPTPHPGSRLDRCANELGLKVITRDLTKYLHLYPVAIPGSLGIDRLNALEVLVDAHNTIRLESKMTDRNPLLDLSFVLSYADRIDV